MSLPTIIYTTLDEIWRHNGLMTLKQLEDKMLEKEMALGKNEDKKAINKLDEQIKENLGYSKESEKIYLSYIKYTNRIQEEFIETKKKI